MEVASQVPLLIAAVIIILADSFLLRSVDKCVPGLARRFKSIYGDDLEWRAGGGLGALYRCWWNAGQH